MRGHSGLPRQKIPTDNIKKLEERAATLTIDCEGKAHGPIPPEGGYELTILDPEDYKTDPEYLEVMIQLPVIILKHDETTCHANDDEADFGSIQMAY